MTSDINREKTAGAFFTPKGITKNSQCPDSVVNAVLCLSLGSISICQYPLCKSSVLNMTEPHKESKHSRIDGNGKISVLVTSFKALKSAQKRYVPSFWGTKRIGEDQGDEDLQMTPLSSIFLIWRSTSGRSASGVLRNFKATGQLVPVLILNFVRSVRPTSESVLANTSR